MPKIKMPVKSPHIDMTPMVDLFSLLLTFFMLTTSFRPQEAAVIDTPFSVSEKPAPEKNVIMVLVDKNNKVFFNMDNGKDSTTHYRKELLQKMGERYNVKFTEKQIEWFSKLNSWGMPIVGMQKWLDSNDPKEKEKMQTGIPMDSLDNQLSMWVRFARITNRDAEAVIKGDGGADFKVVKKVMDIMQENKVNKFNLTTNLQSQVVTLDQIK
ncbi:MAG: biopolymer transporter ExbD [Bacteroidota bacterium]